MLKILFGIFLAVAIAVVFRHFVGFWAQRPADYAQGAPEFDIKRHLSGEHIVEGVIFGPFGKVVSRFEATMTTTWEGDEGRIHEVFTYANSETQTRNWELQLNGDKVTAQAPDIIGEARGEQSGNALNLAYRIELPESAGGHVLSARDWLYLLPNGTMVNRNEMRKFGIKVAELVATIKPVPGE